MEQIDTTHEVQVIGAALAESGHWLAHAAKLRPDLFVTYHVLARELLAMTAAGHPTDPRSAQTWMAQREIETKVSNLLWLADQAPISQHAMSVAVEHLHDRVKRDALRTLSRSIVKNLERSARTDEILEHCFGALTSIVERSTTDVLQIGSVIHEVIKHLGQLRQDGVKTGIPKLDLSTSGFKPGELAILGGRPSMGKTALALGFASKAAMAGKSVLIFSLEMSTNQLCQRLLSGLSRVNLARIVTHRVDSIDINAVTNAANVAHKWRLFVGEDTNNIEAVCRQVKHRHGLDFVVVDYLQLMSCRAESREQQIATLSRNLKQLARRLDIPVLVLSQLNRSVETRACKQPQLSDLRESGAIEQDADLVLLLWRAGYYEPDIDQTQAELLIAKNRNGPTGFVPLTWFPACARFEPKKA